MQSKTLAWTIVVLVVLALIIWGIASMGGDDSGSGDGSGSEGGVSGGGDDAGSLADNTILGEDEVDLGDVI